MIGTLTLMNKPGCPVRKLRMEVIEKVSQQTSCLRNIYLTLNRILGPFQSSVFN